MQGLVLPPHLRADEQPEILEVRLGQRRARSVGPVRLQHRLDHFANAEQPALEQRDAPLADPRSTAMPFQGVDGVQEPPERVVDLVRQAGGETPEAAEALLLRELAPQCLALGCGAGHIVEAPKEPARFTVARGDPALRDRLHRTVRRRLQVVCEDLHRRDHAADRDPAKRSQEERHGSVRRDEGPHHSSTFGKERRDVELGVDSGIVLASSDPRSTAIGAALPSDFAGLRTADGDVDVRAEDARAFVERQLMVEGQPIGGTVSPFIAVSPERATMRRSRWPTTSWRSRVTAGGGEMTPGRGSRPTRSAMPTVRGRAGSSRCGTSRTACRQNYVAPRQLDALPPRLASGKSYTEPPSRRAPSPRGAKTCRGASESLQP